MASSWHSCHIWCLYHHLNDSFKICTLFAPLCCLAIDCLNRHASTDWSDVGILDPALSWSLSSLCSGPVKTFFSESSCVEAFPRYDRHGWKSVYLSHCRGKRPQASPALPCGAPSPFVFGGVSHPLPAAVSFENALHWNTAEVGSLIVWCCRQ